MPLSCAFSLASISIHAAAPAATAPGLPFSTGIMRSVPRTSVRYSWSFSALGLYDPPLSDCAASARWWTSCADTRSSTPVAISVRPSRRSTSRRVMSDIALPHFFGQILGGAPGERNDRVRGILVGVADERRAVGHQKIVHLVCLAEAVQRARLWIVAHTDSADLVNDRAAS